MKITENITITNEDNMELMDRYPDKYFDLAIVDPPYGIDKDLFRSSGSKFQSLYYKNRFDLNSRPNEQYFKNLFRVSKNQIIWGGNYFTDLLPITANWFVWDKQMPDGITFRDFEMAWTSITCKIIKLRHYGGVHADGNKTKNIHPTQKPVALYKWLLDKYAKQGDKILDTHLGSGSIAIACHDYGFELTACELDAEYYDKAIQRIKNHVSQQKLF